LLVGGDGSIVAGTDDDEGDGYGDGSSGETLLQMANGKQVRTHRPRWIPSKE
jgi:hypothetical protein